MFTSINPRRNRRQLAGLKTTVLALVSVTASTLAARNIAAQTLNHWSSGGPEGGHILSLAIDPNNPAIIYAGTANGVFKSTDRGDSWSSSLSSGNTSFVAIAPSTPATLYAAGERGIHKTTDGGVSWSAVNNGLENQYGPIYITALAIDPTNANIVYTAGPDVEVGGTYKAIYKTTNGGASWSITKHSINAFAIHNALAIDPTNPNIVYAAGQIGAAGTVWKSSNSGQFWDVFYLGYDSSYIVQDLIIDPTNPNTLYAGNSRGVYKSTDAAQNWSPFNDGLQGNSSFWGVHSIVIDPVNPGVLYAGTYAGIFKSSNGGRWTPLNGGAIPGNPLFHFGGVNALALDSGNPNTVYAGTGGGVFKSSDSGSSWSATNNGLHGGVQVNALTVNPGNGNVYTQYDLFKSTNNGGSWTTSDFFPVAVDPHDSNTIYSTIVVGRNGLSKSTDGGVTWSDTGLTSVLSESYVSSVAIVPNNSEIIYAAVGGRQGGVFKSADGGATWIQSISVPDGISTIAIDPRNSNIVYAVGNNLLKSTDGGGTWNPASALPGLGSLQIDPGNSQNLYAFACGYLDYYCDTYDLYKSIDGGAHWISIYPSSNSFVLDPVHPNIIYIGNGDGVFKSTDGGVNWNPFNDGLTELNVYALAINASGTFLHAGTSVGVFDVQITAAAEPTPTPTPNPIDNAQFFVIQHYRDFLNREPEPGGMDAWLRVLGDCPTGDDQCLHHARLVTSAAIFGSPEFQLKGYFVFRFYRVAFNRLPAFEEILPDMQSVTGQTPAEVYTKKSAFTEAFVARSEFSSTFGSLSNAEFIVALLSRYGLDRITTPQPANPDGTDKVLLTREDLVQQLNAGILTRAQILRAIVESDEVFQSEFNRAFVAMQYYGYLRRTPETAGYQNWLDYLNSHPSDFLEMVRGFVDSTEYRHRFGP